MIYDVITFSVFWYTMTLHDRCGTRLTVIGIISNKIITRLSLMMGVKIPQSRDHQGVTGLTRTDGFSVNILCITYTYLHYKYV